MFRVNSKKQTRLRMSLDDSSTLMSDGDEEEMYNGVQLYSLFVFVFCSGLSINC